MGPPGGRGGKEKPGFFGRFCRGSVPTSGLSSVAIRRKSFRVKEFRWRVRWRFGRCWCGGVTNTLGVRRGGRGWAGGTWAGGSGRDPQARGLRPTGWRRASTSPTLLGEHREEGRGESRGGRGLVPSLVAGPGDAARSERAAGPAKRGGRATGGRRPRRRHGCRRRKRRRWHGCHPSRRAGRPEARAAAAASRHSGRARRPQEATGGSRASPDRPKGAGGRRRDDGPPAATATAWGARPGRSRGESRDPARCRAANTARGRMPRTAFVRACTAWGRSPALPRSVGKTVQSDSRLPP